MQKFHLFTMVYGQHYVELFKRAVFKSMCWPRNKAALEGKTWVIATREEHIEELGNLVKAAGFQPRFYKIGDSIRVDGCGFVPFVQCDIGRVLLASLIEHIAYSINEKSKMIFAPPDTIFGDGTIPNMMELGAIPTSCVAAIHPRVLPSILEEIETLGATRGAISNAQLVTMAFNHAHDSWKFAEVGHKKNTSFTGGIAWKKLTESGLYSVCHRLPTVYLADFTSSDFDFFWGQSSFGGWDHRWPAENLIRQERQRLVGSSDACFVVEVTDWDKNVPPGLNESIESPNKFIEDAYWNGHYHNGINRQTAVILRGE